MTTIKATIKDRRIELEVPADWPDGTEVEIHPLEHTNGTFMSPAEIADVLAAMEKVEPFDLSEAEKAAWDAERQARKDREKAVFTEDAERLRRTWE